MKTMIYSRIYALLCMIMLGMAFTACDKDAHEGEYPLGSGEGAFVVGLQSDTETEELSLYFFGEDGIGLSSVRLLLTLPESDMPAYTSTRAKDGENTPLHCVAEIYLTGTDNLIHHREWNASMQLDGTYLAELSLMPGDYDLRLWADWGRLLPCR